MRKHIAILAVIFAAFLLCPLAVPARTIEDWSYEKLFKKSDLVVLATAVKTEPGDDKWSPYPSSWQYEFAAQNTTFTIKHVLKGKVEGDQLKVLHFKFGELKKGLDPKDLKNQKIINAPRFVTFRVKPVTVIGDKGDKTLRAPAYLLFLKVGLEGRYEPISGRIDPVDSVKEVFEAPDTVFGDK